VRVIMSWVEDSMALMTTALSTIYAMIDEGSPHLVLQRLTPADVTAFIAERLAQTSALHRGADTAHARSRDAACRRASFPLDLNGASFGLYSYRSATPSSRGLASAI
jgi:hypothetical protein